MTYKVAEHEMIAPLIFDLFSVKGQQKQQIPKRKSTIAVKDFINSARKQQERKLWEKNVKKGRLL